MDRTVETGRPHPRAIARRRIAQGLVACIFVAAIGCSGGGSAGGVTAAGATASFRTSETAARANLVRLTGSAAGDVVTLQVAISGETASDQLYAFSFDLELSDPDVASYVTNSAVFGTALTLEAGEQSSVQVSQEGSRITVGVTKLGDASGNGIGETEETIVSLDFRVITTGVTTIKIVGSGNEAPQALGPPGPPPEERVITSVDFDDASAVISGT